MRQNIDRLLYGGIPLANVTEIAGIAGLGKTDVVKYVTYSETARKSKKFQM